MGSTKVVFISMIVILAMMACNLSNATVAQTATQTVSAQTAPTNSPAPGNTDAPVSADIETPAAPPPSAEMPSSNVPVPAAPVYDSESASTASLKYAGNGDAFPINRFERPFTKQEMVYLDYIDILKFGMSKDATWYYGSVTIENLGSSLKDGLAPVYGIEVDEDLDGRGDYLIWVKPPFSTTWNNSNVSVFADRNHDVGGLRPEKADPLDKAGNGYETVIVDSGKGDDPYLAWVRVDPGDSSVLQIAFKKTLISGKSFEWDAWADAGLKDPAQFNYNDRMSVSDAGSPLKGDPNYPLKGLSAVDDTCYEPFGTTVGYLPLICPRPDVPTKRPDHPTSPPGATPQPTATWTQKPPS